MDCPVCNTDNSEDAHFCRQCGFEFAATTNVSMPTYNSNAKLAKPKTTKPIFVLIVGLCILAGAGIGFALAYSATHNSPNEEEPPTSESIETKNSEQSSTTSEKPEETNASTDEIFEEETATTQPLQQNIEFSGHYFMLDMPDDLASKIQFKAEDDFVLHASIDNTNLFAIYPSIEADLSDGMKHVSGENKKRNCLLGFGSAGLEGENVGLTLFYIDPSGTGNAHWNNGNANELAIERLLGLSTEELVSFIKLSAMKPEDVVNVPPSNVVPKWTDCTLEVVSDDAWNAQSEPAEQQVENEATNNSISAAGEAQTILSDLAVSVDEFRQRLNEIDIAKDNDPRMGGTTRDMNEAGGEYSLQYEALMNDILQYVEGHPRIDKTWFRNSQGEWEANLQQEQEAIVDEFWGGSGVGPALAGNRMFRQHERIEELLRYVEESLD